MAKLNWQQLRTWSLRQVARIAWTGQVPAEVLKMYDELTRDQHALVRTSTVLLSALRRRLGLPEL
ncbi:hypothetical protein [Stenotrophomonas sp. G106K1]|uniref:hypothetical protein n=1 Tax=Stenotrophomonas sp. G106K1 TaxID=3134792 RepID=UPI0030F46ABF